MRIVLAGAAAQVENRFTRCNLPKFTNTLVSSKIPARFPQTHRHAGAWKNIGQPYEIFLLGEFRTNFTITSRCLI